jgi:hypothetical protein
MSTCLEIAGGNRSHGTITETLHVGLLLSSLLVTKTKTKKEKVRAAASTKEAVILYTKRRTD